jgi:hypothetical protein
VCAALGVPLINKQRIYTLRPLQQDHNRLPSQDELEHGRHKLPHGDVLDTGVAGWGAVQSANRDGQSAMGDNHGDFGVSVGPAGVYKSQH